MANLDLRTGADFGQDTNLDPDSTASFDPSTNPDSTANFDATANFDPRSLRIGQGMDVHALVSGRKLIIGGVDIPYELGLDGHSDADVLTHAICDAILGAARAGDIGKLFPPDDPAFEGADSLKLLSRVSELVREQGFEILDVDSVIAAQAPKLSPYRDQMRHNLAESMGVGVDQVGVKATTTEHLGFEGRGEGISATAACLLYRVR